MNDPAFELLVSAINSDNRESLVWVVDENLSAEMCRRVAARPQLRALTNRVDIRDRLVEQGIAVELSDFVFETVEPDRCDAIYFRVSKEKAIVHHIVNRAADYLKTGAELVLAGCKNEGIKTYADKATRYLGTCVDRQRGRKTAELYRIARGATTGPPLDDRDYRQTLDVAEGELLFLSKPGLYGWNKIDKGSQLLVATLPQLLQGLARAPLQVVDLGCGYGYLSVMSNRLIESQRSMEAQFIATDNNAAAVDMCRQNFARHGVVGEVILADCGGGVAAGAADLVLCNPPFHQGFAVEGDLTDRFLRRARELLKPAGCALFVVNSFIPLEKKAQAYFANVEILVNSGSFKVALLRTG